MQVESVCIFAFEDRNLVCEKVFFEHGLILPAHRGRLRVRPGGSGV